MSKTIKNVVFLIGMVGFLPNAFANDYPTAEIGDYMLQCMATQPYNKVNLNKCACGIDTIASQVPYENYQKARTVLSMRNSQYSSEQVAAFRKSKWLQKVVDEYRSAQAEALVRCYF